MNQLDLINKIDRNINTIFRTARIRIERTKTSKESLKIEVLYLPKITRIFKTIVRDYQGNKLYLLYEAEKRYGTEIQALIKSMVTRSYLLGIEYISRATNKQHLMFLTNGDITNILLKSDEAYRMFWRLVTKHLQVLRNRSVNKTAAVTSHQNRSENITGVTLTDEIFAMEDEKDNRLLDPETSAKLIAAGIVTSTVAFATLQKYRDYRLQQQQQILAEEEEFFDIDIFEDEEGGGGIPEGEIGDTVVYATENDANVCPICSSLEGLEWDIDDPSIVVPESDTHPNCRCRLLIKINGNIMAK